MPAGIGSASTNSDNTIFWFLQQKPRRGQPQWLVELAGKNLASTKAVALSYHGRRQIMIRG
jgi:hypothetical protein